MSIQNRLDDARQNLAEGRLVAAMLSYVTAIAGTFSKTVSRQCGTVMRFERFAHLAHNRVAVDANQHGRTPDRHAGA